MTYQPFRYILSSAVTGAYLGTLPFTGVTFGAVLNGGGQFQGQLDLADLNTQAMGVLAQTVSGKTVVSVDYNGSILKSYMLWQRPRQAQSGKFTMNFQGTDLWSYFAQRILPTDYSSPPFSGITGPSTPMSIWNAANSSFGGVPTGWDPVLMAWQMVSDSLAVESPYSYLLGGIGFAANGYTSPSAYLASGTGTPASNYVAETYPFSSLQTIDTMISQLSQLGWLVGFDRGLDTAYSNGPLSVPVGTINFSYPRRGRTVSQTNFVCDLRAARSYQFPEDASQTANTVYETGTSGCIVAIQNIYPLEQQWPVLEKTISRSQIQSANIQQLLYAIGMSDLYLDSYPVVVPQIVVDALGNNPPLGQFIEGDDILVTIPAVDPSMPNSGPFDPSFPSGYSGSWRIQQWSVQVGDDGDCPLTLTLNIPPAASATGPSI